MQIFYKADRIMSDGEILIVGRIYKDDVLPDSHEKQMNGALAGHGETVRCTEVHAHSKDCAKSLLPLVKASMESYFKAWDEAPEDPVHVEMPKKTVVSKVDGKDKKIEVDDRDL